MMIASATDLEIHEPISHPKPSPTRLQNNVFRTVLSTLLYYNLLLVLRNFSIRPSVMIGSPTEDDNDESNGTDADVDADFSVSAGGEGACPGRKFDTVRVNVFVSGDMFGGCGIAPSGPAPPQRADPANVPVVAACWAVDA